MGVPSLPPGRPKAGEPPRGAANDVSVGVPSLPPGRPKAGEPPRGAANDVSVGVSYWKDRQEESGEQAHDLRVAMLAAAALFHAHVGDLGALHGIAGLDRTRVHLAGEAQHVHVGVDTDLLLALDQQVTVGQPQLPQRCSIWSEVWMALEFSS
jgi:hypothetical protein